jgi:hypothetical protein
MSQYLRGRQGQIFGDAGHQAEINEAVEERLPNKALQTHGFASCQSPTRLIVALTLFCIQGEGTIRPPYT